MRILMLAVWILATTGIALGQVTSNSILEETTNLGRLTKRPDPYYTTAQASSYDRKSVTPGNADWFANADAGQFIRVEEVEGRKERVMAELAGPGAVVRIWSANPAGTLRFYFDGEATPRWVVKTKDLLGGQVAPFAYPFGYEASSGWDFYYPLPYAKSLKITVDDSENDGARHLYYHVGYRTYPAGTEVQTFDPNNVDTDALAKFGNLITNPYVPGYVMDLKRVQIGSGKSSSAKLPAGPQAVTFLYVRLNPQKLPSGASYGHPLQIHNQLQSTILEATFDGETCVRVPIGDFFGTAPGINPYKSFPMQVDGDGGMSCRFVMPYAKSAEIRFVNAGSAPVQLAYYVETFKYTWDKSSYHFKAQWTGEHARTRPMRDMNFLKVAGEGVFVGDNLHVSNPDPAWWGEGDEKIYFDDQNFPSMFGTGSEDYFGYAWGSNRPYARPFHAQTHGGNPDSFGHSFEERFHIADAIHYERNFRFDMEMWHWADVIATYVHTAYWYAKPGGTTPAAIDPKLLTVYELNPPEPVKGALEGEALKIVSVSGGETEKQGGFWQTSGQTQLWWKNGSTGDKLDLIVPVQQGGRYRVIGHFCFARDYGIMKMALNGVAIKPIDFYSADLTWKIVDLGTFDLPQGDAHLVVEIAGTNPKANPKSYMYGLDYLKLDRK